MGVNAALQQSLFIVSGSPSNPMLGDPNAVLEVHFNYFCAKCGPQYSENFALHFRTYLIAANDFYRLRLPIQSNPKGGNPNSMQGS